MGTKADKIWTSAHFGKYKYCINFNWVLGKWVFEQRGPKQWAINSYLRLKKLPL